MAIFPLHIFLDVALPQMQLKGVKDVIGDSRKALFFFSAPTQEKRRITAARAGRCLLMVVRPNPADAREIQMRRLTRTRYDEGKGPRGGGGGGNVPGGLETNARRAYSAFTYIRDAGPLMDNQIIGHLNWGRVEQVPPNDQGCIGTKCCHQPS